MVYKIFSVHSYDQHDVNNDNIDLRVITEEGRVFAGTFVTRANVEQLMIGRNRAFLWIEDMVIIENLDLGVIREVVVKMITDKILNYAFSEIGDIKKVYGEDKTFENLIAREGSFSIIIEV